MDNKPVVNLESLTREEKDEEDEEQNWVTDGKDKWSSSIEWKFYRSARRIL